MKTSTHRFKKLNPFHTFVQYSLIAKAKTIGYFLAYYIIHAEDTLDV